MVENIQEQPRSDAPKNTGVYSSRQRILIMGAAGREFHIFNVCFRDKLKHEVVAFTAQIPGIEDRRYPPLLSGALYASHGLFRIATRWIAIRLLWPARGLDPPHNVVETLLPRALRS